MTAYYNEIDHAAAAWLRELKGSALGLPADSSSDQADGDMLGREPKPSLAKPSWRMFGALQVSHALACVLSPLHAPLHMPRTPEGQLGSARRTDGSCCQRASSPSSWRGRSLPFLGGDHEKTGLISHCSPSCIHPSTTIYCAVQGLLRTMRRTLGMHGQLPLASEGSFSSSALCTVLNSISDASESPAFQLRTRRISAEIVPFLIRAVVRKL